MPSYIITKSPGHDWPVGKEFESESLHPSMLQHVRRTDGAKTVKPVDDPNGHYEQDAGKAETQAYKIAAELKKAADKAEATTKKAATKPATTNGGANGPGENS